MKQSMVLIILFGLSFTYVRSQDDKDEINNDNHSASAASRVTRESLWSMSNFDPTTAVKPTYNRTTGWDTTSARASVGGIMFDNSSSQPAKHSNRGSTVWEQNARSHAAQTDRAVAGMKRLQAWKEEARRKAEEEKRRKAAEDRRDFEQGYANHKMATSYFYANKAAEDAWLHTEGVRRLEQIEATDRARIPDATPQPTVDTKSGGQLADLLNDSRHIQVVVIKPHNEQRRTDVSLTGNATYDIFDGGRTYDLDEWTWDIAMEASLPEVTRLTTSCMKTEEEILLVGDTLDLKSFNISTLQYNGCVLFVDDSVYMLDGNGNDDSWYLPDSLEQVVICGGRLFGKKKQQVVEIRGRYTSTLCTFETENFQLGGGYDDKILVLSKTGDISVVLTLDLEKGVLDELARTGYNIRQVVAQGNNILALVDDCIMRIDGDPRLLYCNEEQVNDICLTAEGLLIATQGKIAMLSPQSTLCNYSSKGASRLWYDNENVYAINSKNQLIKYIKTK